MTKRVIRNTNNNGDLIHEVNVGGVLTEVLKIKGSDGSVEIPGLITDDVMATKLGFKIYEHGGSYNASLAPTITLVDGGGTLSSVDQAHFIPYQMQDGSWRLKFNVAVNLSNTSRTLILLNAAGVTSVANLQAIFGISGTTLNAALHAGWWSSSSGNFGLRREDANSTVGRFSGDIALASKPTWAY